MTKLINSTLNLLTMMVLIFKMFRVFNQMMSFHKNF